MEDPKEMQEDDHKNRHAGQPENNVAEHGGAFM
jgi:hypothetical protein